MVVDTYESSTASVKKEWGLFRESGDRISSLCLFTLRVRRHDLSHKVVFPGQPDPGPTQLTSLFLRLAQTAHCHTLWWLLNVLVSSSNLAPSGQENQELVLAVQTGFSASAVKLPREI